MVYSCTAYGFHHGEAVCYELGRKTKEERDALISAKECYAGTFMMNDSVNVDIFKNKGKTYEMLGK